MVEVTDQIRASFLDEWEFMLSPSIDWIKNDRIKQLLTFWYQKNGTEYTETNIPVSINNIFNIEDSSEEYDGNTDELTDEDLANYFGQKISDIQNPIHNMVYKIKNEKFPLEPTYMIYYIDEKWYPVTFDSKDTSIIYAQVPVNGMINYRGDLIRRSYEN
jgi:hypothetical protein